jgi:hypothetical protein
MDWTDCCVFVAAAGHDRIAGSVELADDVTAPVTMDPAGAPRADNARVESRHQAVLHSASFTTAVK